MRRNASVDITEKLEDVIQICKLAAFSVEEKAKLMGISKEINDNISFVNAESNKKLEGMHSEILKLNTTEIEFSKKNEEMLVDLKNVLEKLSETEVAECKKILENMNELKRLPQDVVINTNELMIKMNAYILSITREMKKLVEDIKEENKKITRDFNNAVEDIVTSVEEYNDGVSEEIKELGKQYIQFEKLVGNLIQEINLMSEKDYEIMKGFLND